LRASSGLSEFSKIVPGKTRKQDVVAILGAPSRAGKLRAEERENVGVQIRRRPLVLGRVRSDGVVALTNVTVDFNSSRYGGP
jgi:hypothetical protein